MIKKLKKVIYHLIMGVVFLLEGLDWVLNFLKTRLGIKILLLGILALVVLTFVSVGIYFYKPPQVDINKQVFKSTLVIVPPAPVAGLRNTLTRETVQKRSELFIIRQYFNILTNEAMMKSLPEVLKYRDLIEKASLGKPFSADLFAGLLWIEGQGKTNAKSPTGPVGVAQFTEETAKNLGLIIIDVDVYEKVKVKKGKKWVFEKKFVGKKRIRDDRLDPEKSINAAAGLLYDEYVFFGDVDFAIAAYHMGRPRLLGLVRLYLEDNPVVGGKAKLDGLTYGEIFFSSTPYHRKELYKQIVYLTLEKDWSPRYYFKILAARDLLVWNREDKTRFNRMVSEIQLNKDDPSRVYWTWYTKHGAYDNFDELKKSWQNGRLVAVPNEPDVFNFKLRLTGSNRIAQADPDNQAWYCGLAPETLACLKLVAKSYFELQKRNNPLEITSLIRTLSTQKKIAEVNNFAKTELPLHCLGVAFDISVKDLPSEDLRDLKFVLDDLEWVGILSWAPEEINGKLQAFHVVVAPNDKIKPYLQEQNILITQNFK